MNGSILISIKKLLGLAEDYTEFDQDLIIHINSVFSILYQLGVGPSTPFYIEGDQETWGQFVRDELPVRDVITYVYLKVKMLFDPATNSSILSAQERLINELEWRLNVAVDPANES